MKSTTRATIRTTCHAASTKGELLVLEEAIYQSTSAFLSGWLVGGITCTLITLLVLRGKNRNNNDAA